LRDVDRSAAAPPRDRAVETRLYSVSEEKLLWAGVTRTLNPHDLVELVDEIARAVGDELEAQRLAP
jgi:hypothetical protein